MKSIDDQTMPEFARPKRRPGPFGPAIDLLPNDQQLQILDEKTPASDAIERMVDDHFSQIPVSNANDEIIGVFTWRSFAKRVFDLKAATKINTAELPIREAMEPAKFILPDVYIDTETDWEDIDYVLVGTPTDPIGILCIADVFGRLTDFAEAFVLIYEIEHEVRDLIRDVYTEDELAERFEEMNLSAKRPALEVAAKLEDHINEKGKNPVIGKAIGMLKKSGSRPLSSLEDFSFSQYKDLICSELNWPRFEPVFDRMRKLVDIDIQAINELRNVVFHFRRRITTSDTDRLRRFRDSLKYDRSLFARSKLSLKKAE